ncbi:MAG: helix-turn-helix transcriptional regulator, partial [Clostridiales bacterium]|nr:helix-turn-helix transcriptional regulator [Clostridiales bacterium]
MITIGGKDAKERIVGAAVRLFSRKGYDATRVSDIAGAAKVNKALIYYYFKSKEDILDFMIDAVLRDAVSITLDFIQSDVARLVKEGYLEIRPDRL